MGNGFCPNNLEFFCDALFGSGELAGTIPTRGLPRKTYKAQPRLAQAKSRRTAQCAITNTPAAQRRYLPQLTAVFSNKADRQQTDDEQWALIPSGGALPTTSITQTCAEWPGADTPRAAAHGNARTIRSLRLYPQAASKSASRTFAVHHRRNCHRHHSRLHRTWMCFGVLERQFAKPGADPNAKQAGGRPGCPTRSGTHRHDAQRRCRYYRQARRVIH